MAEGSDPGAHWIHDRLEQVAQGIGRTGVGRGSGEPAGSQTRAAGEGRAGDRRRISESKEFLAGYWIVDVENTGQAYAIAARASAAPGQDGAPMNMPIEVRQVMSGPPDDLL